MHNTKPPFLENSSLLKVHSLANKKIKHGRGKRILQWLLSTLVCTALPLADFHNMQPAMAGTNPLLGAKFYVDPNSHAKNQANQWRSSQPADAAVMDKLAQQPIAKWFGDVKPDIKTAVSNYVTAAAKTVPVLVAYNIPNRDCSSYSGGGATSPSAYRSWIDGFASGIGNRQAVVIVEPDALPLFRCLSAADQQTRLSLISYAVTALKALPNTAVYIDAGHSNWISVPEMALRLTNAGIAQADGFSSNISNFYSLSSELSYANSLSSSLGGKHFIIDTSRNGLGPTSDFQVCNPPGRALGLLPTANTGQPLADAYLWIKEPGASDGSCNGAPTAGAWWPQYALDIARRAGY